MNADIRGLSYLDAIRPDPGWETDLALVTSYSCDMVVLVAVMLALAGLDDERGSGSKVDFVTAHENLRDRLRFLVQAGRMTVPKVKPAILGIMDRFVCEIKTDEHVRSWHPKLALIRYRRPEQDLVQWRFWIGSRNLTRDDSYDLGLLLVATPGEDGTPIAGMGDMGRVLMEMSGLTRHTPTWIRRELDSAAWVGPAGITVTQIEFRHDGHITGLPDAPEELEELLVISPFLDGGTTRQLGAWGTEATRRLLLSSRMTLSALLRQAQKPLAGFEQLLYMDAPDADSEHIKAGEDQDEAEQLLRGLHAKLICAKVHDGARVWLGSANATARGWQGINTEAIIELGIDDALYKSLREFVAKGAILNKDESENVDSDTQEELLEVARKAIVSVWDVRLVIKKGTPVLESGVALNPGFPEIRMDIGLLTSHLVNCPSGVKTLRLPTVATYQLTEFVLVQLSLGELKAEWVQKVDVVSGLPRDRDQRAMAHHLNPRAFLEWIRSLLHPVCNSDGGGNWDDESKPGKGTRGGAVATTPWWAPSLEEVLRAWSRNPDSLRVVDQKLKAYVKYLNEQDSEESSAGDLGVLQEFVKTWNVIRPELTHQDHHG